MGTAGKPAPMVPPIRTEATAPMMCLLPIVPAMTILTIMAIMALIIAVSFDMTFMGGPDIVNAGSFIAVVVFVFVAIRIIPAVITGIPVISITVALISGFI